MKKFYYTITNSTTGRFGGSKKTAHIYTVKRGQIVYCCAAKWHTSGYRGEKSEVFQSLMANGFIPKKYEKSSVCEWRGAGYFAGEVEKHFSIEELPTY